VAHPLFWVNEAGEHPSPFTLITAEQVKNGEWKTTREDHRVSVFLAVLLSENERIFVLTAANLSALQAHGKFYTEALEAGGRFTLCIWPYHCLIGTPGHAVHPELTDALHEWAEAKLQPINYVMKGTNPLTEHYSALRADVVIDSDPTTGKCGCDRLRILNQKPDAFPRSLFAFAVFPGLNTELVEKLKGFDRVLICGQALSHCVNFTTRDLAEQWPADR
jgi:nicotinamidase-related amidase